MSIVLVVVAVILLLLSALLSAAETASFSLGSSRLRTLQEEGFRGADKLALLRDRPESVRGSLIVVSVILDGVAVGFLTLTGSIWGGSFGAIGSMLVAVLLAVLVSEVLPRLFAGRRPVRIALGMAPVVGIIVRGVTLVLSPLGRLEQRLDREEPEITREARVVREIARIGREEGVVDEDENLLVERAFRLDEMTARDVMTPRVDVFSWDESLTLEEIVSELKEVPYSRVPVHGESVDDVTGILYVREALEAYVAGKGQTRLSQLGREPLFVPASSPLTRLLRQFQARRIHMGIVADEFGGTDGLVTLEDVLEELVGEIVDETDLDEEPFVRLSRHELIANANADLREVNHALNVSLPMLEHRSVNGLILEELGHVPEAGHSMTLAGVTIEILDATDTQVVKVRMRKNATGTGSGGSAA